MREVLSLTPHEVPALPYPSCMRCSPLPLMRCLLSLIPHVSHCPSLHLPFVSLSRVFYCPGETSSPGFIISDPSPGLILHVLFPRLYHLYPVAVVCSVLGVTGQVGSAGHQEATSCSRYIGCHGAYPVCATPTLS